MNQINRIGIFGDSYAAEWDTRIASYAWVNQLKRAYPQVDVWADGGASFAWAYRHFLHNHLRYDRVIFMVTSGARIYMEVPYMQQKSDVPRVKRHWAGPEDLANIKASGYGYSEAQLKFIEQYFVYMGTEPQNSQMEYVMIAAAVKNIRALRPDALIIPCFDQFKRSGDLDLIAPYTWSMESISLTEWEHRGWDRRPNHMTPRSHNWFVQHIRAWIDQNTYMPWEKGLTAHFDTEQDMHQACRWDPKNQCYLDDFGGPTKP